MPRSLSCFDSRSDFSIETVPTRTGRCLLLLLDDVGDDRFVLLALGAVDGVRLFDPLELAVGRNHHHVELVDLRELRRLGVGGAGHAGQLGVFPEVVLEGDGRERLVLALDLHLLLRFHRLVQPVAPAPARHQPAGELVDDDDLAVLDHVVDVEAEQGVRPQRLVDVVQQRHVDRVVEAAGLQAGGEHLLGLRHAALRQRHGLVLLVDDVVAGLLELLAILRLDVAARGPARREPGDDAIDFVIEIGGLFGWTRDDQRRPRLVDEDAVHFVDDREVVAPLHVLREVELHVVAQVVEAELVVGAVGDVAAVGDLPLQIGEVVLDDPDGHAEEAVDAPHPLRVAARQVVVDGDDVDALAFEGVEIGGQRCDEGLAFARLHLGNLAAVEHGAADELHVEVPHVQRPLARLADHGKRVGQQVVERLAVRQPLAQLARAASQLVVRQLLDFGFLGVDLQDDRPDALEIALVLRADDLGENRVENHAGDRTGISLILSHIGTGGRASW